MATIGLLSDRLICVAKYDESKEPFRVYDMPSYAFDSNEYTAHLHYTNGTNHKWSNLINVLLTKSYRSTQIVSIQDNSTNDFIYIQRNNDALVYDIKHEMVSKLPIHFSSDMIWISSIESWIFYGMRKQGKNWRIAKYKFIGSLVITELNQIEPISTLFYICFIDNDDYGGNILMKKDSCNQPTKEWQILTGFDDKDHIYLLGYFDNLMMKPTTTIIDKSSMSSKVGQSSPIMKVSLKKFITCSAAPLPPPTSFPIIRPLPKNVSTTNKSNTFGLSNTTLVLIIIFFLIIFPVCALLIYYKMTGTIDNASGQIKVIQSEPKQNSDEIKILRSQTMVIPATTHSTQTNIELSVVSKNQNKRSQNKNSSNKKSKKVSTKSSKRKNESKNCSKISDNTNSCITKHKPKTNKNVKKKK